MKIWKPISEKTRELCIKSFCPIAKKFAQLFLPWQRTGLGNMCIA
jgi:hypothetical protein